ncbi:MAG: hypothetical protein MJK15_08695 [Colwellia sp.]|nr:hypothetical protein [Colwellia sp.]
MFKKSLLALSVAAISASATAGTIYSSVAEADVTGITAASIHLTTGDCGDIAADLGINVTNPSNFTLDPGGDIVTGAAAVDTAGVYDAPRVTMTANDTCNFSADIVSTTAISSSIEAAQNIQVIANASIVSGIGGYDVGDTITIAITGATIDKTATEALIPVLNDVSGTATINVLDVEANAVRFTVVGAANTPASVILDLTNVVLDATGLTGETEVSYNAFATNTSGTNFDISSGVVIADLVPQYSATTTVALDGIIDVGQDRQVIADMGAADTAGTGENENEDTLTVTISLDATGTVLVPGETVYTIGGDFSWMMDADVAGNDDGTVDPAEIATVVTYSSVQTDDTVTYALNEEMNELTATANLVTELDLVNTFVFAVSGLGDDNAVLSPTPYTVAVTVNDETTAASDIALVATAGMSAGSWTLNGSVITVPYMPFGENTKVILRHTNTGVQTGDITVRYMLEGTSTNWSAPMTVGTSSRGVMDIRDAVIDAIEDATGLTKGKVAIEIVTNVPSADVTIYAAYNVKNSADDRGFVGTFGEHGSADKT